MTRTALALTLLIVLGACATRFNAGRMAVITLGQDDHHDVKQILGQPAHKVERKWYYVDAAKNRIACIVFDAKGRVASKYYMGSKDVPESAHVIE